MDLAARYGGEEFAVLLPGASAFFCYTVWLAAVIAPVRAQEVGAAKSASVRALYNKAEFMIPMRDGVKLFTAIYTPKDKKRKYPLLLERTPYSCWPYGSNKFKPSVGPSDLFTEAGYIVAYQDVRGRNIPGANGWKSGPSRTKKAQKIRTKARNAYDTIEWLVKNVANNNGRVGTWGISYPGFYVSAE